MIPRSLLILTVATLFAVHTSSQYVDILQGLQTFFQPYQFDITTRKPESRRHGSRHQNRNPTNPTIVFPNDGYRSERPKTTTKPNKTRPNSSQSTRPKSENLQGSRYTTPKGKPKNNENIKSDFGLFNNDNIFFPDDITTNSNRKNSQGDKENRNPTVTSSTQFNKHYNRNPTVTSSSTQLGNPDVTNIQQGNKNNNRNPDVTSINKRPSANWNKQNGITTRKPFTIRPGVKPAPVDESRPPITNRPVAPVFPVSSNPDEPELEVGPDEDDMSSVQKRRYLAMAEQMCDSYKALNVRKIVALPLVPSPEAVEFNVSNCTPINVPLIIGGKVSSIEEFPHMSLVGWRKVQSAGYSWKCGGSLVSDQYVLTAGHCTYHEKDYNVVSGPPHAVQLGSTFVDGPGAVVLRSASVIRHPKFKQRRSYYDVALIKLASRVTFSDTIRPACLGVPPPVGKPIIATGWGRTEFGGDQSLELRSVSLPIWDMQDCKEIWGTSLKLPNGPSSESHVCAGERNGGKDTCQGDSGGPAQVQDGCIWRVVAVTSSGRSCGAPDTPALYATVPRVFVAAEVFGKQELDIRNNNKINHNQPTMNNRNTNVQNNYNQNNQNHRVNVNSQNYNTQNTNTQSAWNTNQNNPNQQNNRNTNQNNNGQQYTFNQNTYNQQSTNNNLNNQNGNTNQFNQGSTNNYNQNTNNQISYNEATTRNPNQDFNYQNSYDQNSNNPNQYYNQNVYVTEGWNQNYNRGIYDYNLGNNEYRVTERPWWSR